MTRAQGENTFHGQNISVVYLVEISVSYRKNDIIDLPKTYF
jgi:hypothetical protein